MKRIIFLALLLMSPLAHAEESKLKKVLLFAPRQYWTPGGSTGDRAFDAANTLNGLVGASDFASTYFVITAGRGREVNPLWATWFNNRPNWAVVGAVSIGLQFGYNVGFRAMYTAVGKIPQKPIRRVMKTFVIVSLLGVTGYRARVVKHNIDLYRRH